LAPEVPPVPTATSAPEHAEQIRDPVPDAGSSFRPSVNKGQQKQIETVPSPIANDQPGGPEEARDGHSKSRNEPLKSSQEASPLSQSTRLVPRPPVDNVPPLKSTAPVSSKTQQDRIAELVPGAKTSFKPLVIKAQEWNAAEPDVEPKGRDKPLATERFSGKYPPVSFRQAPAFLSPNAQKANAQKGENRDLSHHSGLPHREPDEIQIHIGRIEVLAVPPAPAPSAALKPERGTPSLDEYLRRRDGKAE